MKKQTNKQTNKQTKIIGRIIEIDIPNATTKEEAIKKFIDLIIKSKEE